MKRLLKDKGFILFLLFALIAISCKQRPKKAEEEAQKYTCPMHPQVIKDSPGSCPICGMDLVLVRSREKGSGTLSNLIKDPANVAAGSIKTVKAERTSKFTEVKLSGVINYNTNSFKSISSRVGGRIERLYLKYNFQPVKKGEKIMEIYSPDLANAEQELLFLKNNNEPGLLESAKRKLRLLGVTDSQISQVFKTGKVDYTVPVFSPYSGYIAEVANGSSQSSAASSSTGKTSISSDGAGGSMGEMSAGTPSSGAVPVVASANSNAPVLLKEGQYITAGQKLFSLVNAESLWAEFFINPGLSSKLKRGAMVRVQSKDQKSKSQRTTVKLVLPFYQEGTNYVLARATVVNSNKAWRVGELIDVAVESTRQIGNWLPKTAVLSLGTRYVAFARKGAAFVPVYVNVKTVAEDAIDIGSGIDPETEFAENAWFLVDPESFIKPEKLQ